MKKYINSIEESLSRLFQSILNSVGDKGDYLYVFRIILGFSLLTFYTYSWQWIGEVPQGFFWPPILSIASFFDGFPSKHIFFTADVLFAILSLLITIGFYTRESLFLLASLGIFCSSFSFSLGKIDHEILFWLTLYCLSFTNIGNKYVLRKDKEVSKNIESGALAFLAISICFAFFSAGFQKAIHWIDFDLATSGFLSWFYPGYFSQGRNLLFADLVFEIPIWVLELGDYTAAIFEITGIIFLLWGNLAWRSYLIVACIFHTLNLCFLNISFSGHIFVYMIFLIDFKSIYSFPTRIGKKLFYLISVSLFILQLLKILGVAFSNSPFVSLDSYRILNLYGYLFLWLSLLGSGVFFLVQDLRTYKRVKLE
ncbi:MAG: hypothetical protein JXR07_20135 [Reichenbachiella sp.]